MIEILNLGAGVQSTCVALMSVEGCLPKLDYAIFANTGWEPQAVYDHLDWLQPVLEASGITVMRVQQGNIKDDSLVAQVRGKKEGGKRWSSMPYFTTDRETGKHGMVRRQCTYEYKIRPIERAIKTEILGIAPRKRWPTEPVVRRWYGISVDEWQRSRKSTDKWSVNYYPLIEQRMTRSYCLAWLYEHGYPEPPRSACIGCPFHSNREWRHLRDNSPDEFADAVEFDAAIRKCGGERGDVFLHPARIPLGDVDLGDSSQLSIWDDECSGICGV